jgi:CBS domain-containing protein
LRSAVLAPLKNLTAAQIADQPLLVLPSNATCQDAAQAMALRRTHFAPVVLGNRLLGVVTVGQLARAANRQDYVGSVMTRIEELDAISAELPAIQAIERLSSSRLTALPVVSGDALAGFISQATLARILTYKRLHRRATV